MVKINAPFSLWIRSTIFLISAMLFSIYTPHRIFLDEQARMRPGLPPYDWWVTPPDVARSCIYIYNITNAEAFLNGTDAKLELDEIGPIILNEIWTHKNIVFNDNGTLTYTLNKTGIYHPQNNIVNLNDTVIVFNFPLLMAASYLSDAPLLTKVALNSFITMLGAEPIATMTIYSYIFDNSDALFKALRVFVPSLLPFDNAGIARLLYWNAEDNVTMFVGHKNGVEKFSMIDKYNGSPYFPGYDQDCKVNLTNATEFLIVHQNLQKDDVIYYMKTAVCRLVQLHYKETTKKFGLPAYKFEVKKSFLNRTKPEELDCHKGKNTLPDGLSDLSPCWSGLPLVSSLPYFLYGAEILHKHIHFNVNRTLPLPYVMVEPFTGLPFDRQAMLQINALVKPLTGFHPKLSRFSDTVMPIAWAKNTNIDIPWKMVVLLYIFYGVYYLQIPMILILYYCGFGNMWAVITKRANSAKNGGIQDEHLKAKFLVKVDEIDYEDSLLQIN